MCWDTITPTDPAGRTPPCGAARSATCAVSATGQCDGDPGGAAVGAARGAARSRRMGRPAGAGRRGRGRRGPAHAGRGAAGECDRARAAAPGAVPRAPGAARARRRGGRVSVALVGAPLARRSRHPRDRRHAPVRGGRCRAARPRRHRAAAHRRGPATGASYPRALRTAAVAARRYGQGPAHPRGDATPARTRPPRRPARYAARCLHPRRYHRGRGHDPTARHDRRRRRRHRRRGARDVPPERALAPARVRRHAGQSRRHRVRERPGAAGARRRGRHGPLAGPGPARVVRPGDEDPRQPVARLPAWPVASPDRGRRVRRHVRVDHARGHPGGDRGGDPGRARRRDPARHPPGRRPLRRGRASVTGRAVPGPRRRVRAPRRCHGGRAHLLGARPRAATRRRADARRVPGGGGARRAAARDPRLLPAEMTLALLVLVFGLLGASAAAAVGVAAAAVSQLELTRWVTYKLRGGRAAARALENPGRVLATANALTTLGVIGAAGALPALPAQAPPTFLGVFTMAVGVPLFVSAAYLVPRVVGRRWAESIVARAVPWLEPVGRALAPFIPARDPSRRTTLAAVLSGADTGALASAGEMAVVSGVLAFAQRPFEDLLRDLMSEIFEPEPVEPSLEALVRVVELEGSAPASRLEEAFDVTFGSREVQTVGGLLVQALGRIPRAGERLALKGLEFDILAATATRVERVAVRPGPVRAIALDRRESGT